MQGRVASRMPRVVVVSENSIKDIHADMGVSLDRMRLVPVGVDPELFTPLPARHPPARPPHHHRVGRRRAEGSQLPAGGDGQAAHRARRHRLTIIGKPREGASNDLIDKLGLRPHIEFVSGVTDERIVELYAEAELAVVPSLYEGFSLPAIEAMSTGICLVATDGGALPEVTGRDGDTVLQCKAGDVEALAATMRRGLDDAELRARIGAAGRRRVVERWSWKHCAQLTVDQYREVLAMPANVDEARARTAGSEPLLTIRFDRLGVQPGDLVLDAGAGFGRHAFELARLRRQRRRARLHGRRSGHHPRHVRRDGRGRRDRRGALRRRAAGRRHHGCRSTTARSTGSSPARCSSTSRTTSPPSANWCGCCKPGGTFAATVPTWYPEKINWLLSDEYHAPKSVGGHVRIYTATELKAKLRTAGLRGRWAAITRTRCTRRTGG